MCLGGAARALSLPRADAPRAPAGELQYPFPVNDVVAWLAEHVDLIFVFLDPHGQATCKRTMNVIRALKEKLKARRATASVCASRQLASAGQDAAASPLLPHAHGRVQGRARAQQGACTRCPAVRCIKAAEPDRVCAADGASHANPCPRGPMCVAPSCARIHRVAPRGANARSGRQVLRRHGLCCAHDLPAEQAAGRAEGRGEGPRRAGAARARGRHLQPVRRRCARGARRLPPAVL